MTAPELARMLHGRKAGKDTWLAKCPAHSDSRPSLQIKAGRKAVLLKCWPGCELDAILRAVNLKRKDLWYEQKADPKAIREAERLRNEQELAKEYTLRYRRIRDVRMWRWYRVCTALAWLLMRHPQDDTLAACFELALSRIREAPSTWPNPVPQSAPYCPFPPQKLLHGIKAEHVTPQIAKYLKLSTQQQRP